MRIFFDVDTQYDFMHKWGALYVKGADVIIPNLMNLTEYAKEKRVPVLGSVDRHFGTEEYKKRETELQRNGGPFPDHCISGTAGERKIIETLLYTIPAGKEADSTISDRYGDESIYIPHLSETMHVFKQLAWADKVNSLPKWLKENKEHSSLFVPTYFEKQSYDIFTNPAPDFLFGELKKYGKAIVDKAVVYGVATDFCVKAAVFGMIERGIKVYVVEDAIKGVTEEGEKEAIKKMKGKGATFVTTKQVLEDRLGA